MPDVIAGWAAVLVVAPVLTFLHELAHAVVALLVKPGRVEIQCGSGEHRRSFRLGRIDVHMHTPAWFAAGHIGYDAARPTPRGEAAVSLAGPLSSLAMGLPLLAVHFNADLPRGLAELVSAGMVWALVQALATGIPWTYPAGFFSYGGKPSDGLRAWRALAEARAGASQTNG